MDIRRKIQELSEATAQNSITPASLGAILMAMYEATVEGDKANASVISETMQIASGTDKSVLQLSQKVQNMDGTVEQVSKTIDNQKIEVNRVAKELTTVQSEVSGIGKQVTDVKTSVSEVETNIRKLTNSYTVVMANEDGQLQEKQFCCVWKGPKESYDKLCRQGLRDPNTVYIISE